MNKLIIGVVVAVVMAGAGLFVINQGGDDTANSEQTSTTQNKSNAQEFSGSLDELAELGRDYQCSFSNSDDSGNITSGTMYVAGERLSGRFTFEGPSADQTEESFSNIIRDDTHQYVWDNAKKEGFKTSLASFEASDNESTNSNDGPSQPNEIDQDFTFDCDDWQVDDSRFVPPNDVTFADIDQQINQLNESLQQTQQIDASICDQVPAGDARKACEANL